MLGTETQRRCCRIFGEHIVFAVTYTRVERTLFVDINGQRPSILDTPLCRVRFITDFTVDPLIDKFNFGPAVLASGFLYLGHRFGPMTVRWDNCARVTSS